MSKFICTFICTILSCLVLLSLTACEGNRQQRYIDYGPTHGGTLVYGTDREPNCLDPHSNGDMPQTYIARQFLDSLVSEEAGGVIVPWLATKWVISADGLRYDFTLKPGVFFTDGEPFNAQAVADNFRQILDPATQSSSDLLFLAPYYSTAKVLNNLHVQIILKKPYSPLLVVLSEAFFGMEAPKAMARGLNANCASPVGTGPFYVSRWERERQIVLERNPHYNSAPANAKHQGPAYLSRIIWKILKDNTTRYGALSAGKADIIFNIPPEDQESAQVNPAISIQSSVHPGVPFSIDLNTRSFPFRDIRVRKAFILASDAKDAVISSYANVFPYEGNTLTTETPDYDPSQHDPYPFNPGQANALLDAAGWTGRDPAGFRTKDGRSLRIVFPYNSDNGETPPADLTLFQDIQAMEKRVGINVILDPVESAILAVRQVSPTGYDIVDSYWNGPTPAVMYIKDSRDTLIINNGQNTQFAYDKQLDSILIAAAGSTNRQRQHDLYFQAQKLVNQQAWRIGLYPTQTRLGVSRRVKHVWIEVSEGEPVLSDAYLV